MMPVEFSLLWLIPAIPLFSAGFIRFFGKSLLPRPIVHFISCGSVFVSLLLSIAAFIKLSSSPEVPLSNALFSWIHVGTFDVWIRFQFDTLAAVMSLVVSGVGFLIHVYSTGYMSHEEDFHRYFAYLNLFTAMMLILVLGDSLLLMFVGWEGVGLCSYLLIGFWFTDHANASAGKKAFIVNRIGDFGFVLGILAIFWTLGTKTGLWSLDFSVLRENVAVFSEAQFFGIGAATFVTLLLFVGATGKSAQIPLYVWLPDAMAGPTPVSALIHAATMVTAGVYMIARLSFLFDMAPFTLGVIATIGGLTALFAATIALVQHDIKKVLAYSTVSQLGYMFLACGVGAYAAGIFHLMTHAFFKALLFLGAGSVIHALHHEQDLRKMGGLKTKLPITYITFLTATVAISGIPPFAGFFSKDTILWSAWASPHGSKLLWAVGLFSAALTAFYMFRLLFLAFHGVSRMSLEAEKKIHESPKSILIPLVILAVLSAFGGMLWWPDFMPLTQVFPHWLEHSVLLHHMHGSAVAEVSLALASVGVAVAGILLARHFYLVNPEIPKQLGLRFRRSHQLLFNKYWVDEFYNATVIRSVRVLAAAFSWFDRWVIDGLIHTLARITKISAFIQGTFDRWIIDGLVNALAWITIFLGQKLRKLQTGQLQFYLGTMVSVMLAIFLFWTFFVVGFDLGR